MYRPPVALPTTDPMKESTPRYFSIRWLLVLSLLVVVGAIPRGLAADVPRLGGDEGEPASELEERLNAFGGRLEEAREKHGEAFEKHPDLHALVKLKYEKARLTHSNYWASSYRDEKIQANLDAARELLESLVAGTEPALEKHGRLERAYLADNDGSAQPYELYVPENYDGTEDYGLLVYLHGYSPDLNRENWVRYMYPDVIDEYARQTRSIMVMPFARSNTDFQGCGEDDVLRVMREVKEDYRIDGERVVLSGYSMGGMGVWTIGAHYPHKFAALLAMSSRADFYLWKDLQPGDIPPFKQRLAEQEFGANLLNNYRHLPIYMIHGSDDYGIPVEQSRVMYRRLTGAGMDAQYVELEGQGHFFFYREQEARPELVEWLRSRKQISAPKRVTYRTYTLQYSRAYWTEILAMENWSRPAELTCEVLDDGRRLRVTSHNIMRLAVQPPKALVPHPGELSVVWNGETVQPERQGRRFVLGSREPEGENQQPDRVEKTPQLCGPLREVFSDPFVMVYGRSEQGEQPDREMDGEKGTESRELAIRAAVDWVRFAKGRPRIMPAEQVSDTVIEKHNLILFGTPDTNALVRKVLPGLPLEMTASHVEIRGRRYDLAKHGVWCIYPNPLNPDRYVVVNAGVRWGRGLPTNHKYDMIPDFIVYTDEKTDDGTECNKYVAAGFFDQFWQLDPESMWFSKEPR